MKHVGSGKRDATASGSAEPWFGNPLELSQGEWAAICVSRLIELRPSGDRESLQAVAADMARTLHYVDPTMAAEMEHEGGLLDD